MDKCKTLKDGTFIPGCMGAAARGKDYCTCEPASEKAPEVSDGEWLTEDDWEDIWNADPDPVTAINALLDRKFGGMVSRQWQAEWHRLIEAIVPRGPMCRDCADNNGRCPTDDLPCDPTERALELLRAMVNEPAPEVPDGEWLTEDELEYVQNRSWCLENCTYNLNALLTSKLREDKLPVVSKADVARAVFEIDADGEWQWRPERDIKNNLLLFGITPDLLDGGAE